MIKRLSLKYLMAICIAFALAGSTLAMAGEFWSVRCKNLTYGIDFNLTAKKAFIILEVDSGGTIPAASTSNVIKFVNNTKDKFAIFDFGSATKIGVNVSRPEKVIIYRRLQGKTFPVCDATAEIR